VVGAAHCVIGNSIGWLNLGDTDAGCTGQHRIVKIDPHCFEVAAETFA
jgi:hypothetical protein